MDPEKKIYKRRRVDDEDEEEEDHIDLMESETLEDKQLASKKRAVARGLKRFSISLIQQAKDHDWEDHEIARLIILISKERELDADKTLKLVHRCEVCTPMVLATLADEEKFEFSSSQLIGSLYDQSRNVENFTQTIGDSFEQNLLNLRDSVTIEALFNTAESSMDPQQFRRFVRVICDHSQTKKVCGRILNVFACRMTSSEASSFISEIVSYDFFLDLSGDMKGFYKQMPEIGEHVKNFLTSTRSTDLEGNLVDSDVDEGGNLRGFIDDDMDEYNGKSSSKIRNRFPAGNNEEEDGSSTGSGSEEGSDSSTSESSDSRKYHEPHGKKNHLLSIGKGKGKGRGKSLLDNILSEDELDLDSNSDEDECDGEEWKGSKTENRKGNKGEDYYEDSDEEVVVDYEVDLRSESGSENENLDQDQSLIKGMESSSDDDDDSDDDESSDDSDGGSNRKHNRKHNKKQNRRQYTATDNNNDRHEGARRIYKKEKHAKRNKHSNTTADSKNENEEENKNADNIERDHPEEEEEDIDDDDENDDDDDDGEEDNQSIDPNKKQSTELFVANKAQSQRSRRIIADDDE